MTCLICNILHYMKLSIFVMLDKGTNINNLLDTLSRSDVDCEIIFLGKEKDEYEKVRKLIYNFKTSFFVISNFTLALFIKILKKSTGEYFYLECCDNKNYDNRFNKQCDWLDKDGTVDILFCDFKIKSLETSSFFNNFSKLTLLDLYKLDYIPYYTYMFRKSSVTSLTYKDFGNYSFSSYDLSFALLACSCIANKKISCIKEVLCEINNSYETYNKYNVRRLRKTIYRSIKQQEDKAKRVNTPLIPKCGKNELTVCIAFLNEGIEVRNTIKSIKATAGEEVDIILVNDASDDGYDYESDIEDYNVCYIKNEARIGAAASKEKAVMLSQTPYFLLLDAHMRFFEKDWHLKLVNELILNSDRLVCCQTMVLNKDVDGKIINKGEMGTYGAYFKFEKDNYIPQIKWNAHKLNCSNKKNLIPGVLGASYSSSIKYWKKTKGLQGLIHYGQEEAYISTKAWLEGGGCFIIPEIKIGHIFRDKFPYKTSNSMIIYNTLFIDEVLFPTSIKCLAKSVALYKAPKIYYEIQDMMDVRNTELKRLKEYYKNHFQNSFSEFLRLNNLLTPEEEIEVSEKSKRISELVEFLSIKAKSLDDVGLYRGKMSYIILFCLYAKLFNNTEYEDIASEMLHSVLNSSFAELPINMKNGVLGIGWGLLFLKSNDLLEDDISTHLSKIDECVITRSLKYSTDKSCALGIGGVLAYCSARFDKEYSRNAHFPQDYIMDLFAYCDEILSNHENVEMQTYAYAMMVKEIKNDDYRVMPLKIEDIWTLPKCIPKNINNIHADLDGLLGYSLKLISDISKLKTNEKK